VGGNARILFAPGSFSFLSARETRRTFWTTTGVPTNNVPPVPAERFRYVISAFATVLFRRVYRYWSTECFLFSRFPSVRRSVNATADPCTAVRLNIAPSSGQKQHSTPGRAVNAVPFDDDERLNENRSNFGRLSKNVWRRRNRTVDAVTIHNMKRECRIWNERSNSNNKRTTIIANGRKARRVLGELTRRDAAISASLKLFVRLRNPITLPTLPRVFDSFRFGRFS